MAENKSKFLKFQDSNGDGLLDKCDDIIDVVPTKKCPACVPNPNYVTPNWRKRESTQPWFNEKYCKFQVAVQTSHKTILNVNMDQIYLEYQDEAIEGLLEGFDKANNDETRKTLADGIVVQQYELDPRPNSFLKLLYSVPYDTFAPIPAAEEVEDEEDEKNEDEPSDIVVEMAADLIQEKLIKIRKAFNLYSRFHRVYSYIDKGKIVFIESNKLFTVKQFDRYGDNGLVPTSNLGRMMTALDFYLNKKGKNIVGVGLPSPLNDRVTKIEFTFTSKYKLKKLRVWTTGCGGKPYVYNERKLAPLNNTPSWKDKTAVAYFAQMDDIESRISARVAPDWLEVITEFTYPKVYHTKNWPRAEDYAGDPSTEGSCVEEAVKNSLGELGQDLLDEFLSLGDALAYQFNKNLCAKSMGEFIDKSADWGMVIDPNEVDPETGKPGTPKNLLQFATEQAFKEMQDDEQIFVAICARALSGAAADVGLLPGGGQKFLDELWAEGLDRLKICGLFDLLMEAIMCLLGGLTLEQALSKIIVAALKAMNIDNLGKFFIGLPPEKQAELEALVERKLAEGDIFKDPSGSALDGGPGVTSDVIAGKLKYTAPWKRDKRDTRGSPEGDPDTLKKDRPATMAELRETSQLERRTLAQQFDIKSNVENELSDDVIIEAYIKALVEVYADDLLSVIDMLDKFPGARTIAKVIAILDCPRPPILKPSLLDFIKDIDIPWCRNLKDLAMPKLFNPFGWIPKLSDITWILWFVLKLLIQRLIIMIIMKILVKVCELLGDAICKALESVGDLAASVVGLGDPFSFKDAVRDAICGPGASDAKVDATITELFEKLGVGGAALADKDAVMAFTGDLSSAVTRSEMFEAFLGNMSDPMATAAYNLIQYDYPQFSDAFPNKESISDFMGNVGTLMPEEVKQTMRDFLSDLPDDDPFPANPTLCATPEQLDTFKELRCTLLEGRATPEQCRVMFDNLQDDLLEDLEALATVAQKGILPEDLLPPIVSSPGCDDGLVPFESAEQNAAVSSVLNGELKSLKRSYTKDMIGDGGFLGWGSWGLLNMVLADTMGTPLSVHWTKSNNRYNYVDFVSYDQGEYPDPDPTIQPAWLSNLLTRPEPPPTPLQRGNFPDEVASWLRLEFVNMEPNFSLTNDYKESIATIRTFSQLGFVGLFGGVDIDRISIPDMGYAVDLKSNLGTETMSIIRRGRKKTQDIKLEFRDNNKGHREHDGTGYSYGFNIDGYYYDLAEADNGVVKNIGTPTKPIDSMRVDIHRILNPRTAFNMSLKHLMTDDEWKQYLLAVIRSSDPIVDREMEFIAIDHTFDNISPTMFPNFTTCFEQQNPYSPTVYLLQDIILNNNPADSNKVNTDVLNAHIEMVCSDLYKRFKNEIATNEQGFKYGAKYDSLTQEDAEYLVPADVSLSPAGTMYSEALVEDDDGGQRTIRNSDMILGISRDQYLNGDNARIYYLDPSTYGGSYTNPAVYIKPLENEGYLGMVNIMFPEFSPCKPRNVDLVDFDSIGKEIKDTYNQIPEDERLKGDPDCVTEVPYNRILSRQGKAGIEGMVKAACRVFASVHYLKSYATFSTFKPDFDNVIGPAFASYVVENMEREFKDAQGANWEAFNTFKDDEFWYAFLEQAVQTYGRQVDAGIIVDPPKHVLDALFRINDAQENYVYPQITDKRNDVKRANKLEETTAPYKWPFRSLGLKIYRDEKKFDFVQATEEDAKIVLTEFVTKELKVIAENFVTKLAAKDIRPKITNLNYYILSNMCAGAESLDLDKEIIEESTSLPSEGNSHYTSGGELALPSGEEYTGYYHTHIDQDNNVIYMVGERHSSEEHAILTPFANVVSVPIGDVAKYADGIVYVDSVGIDGTKPFILEKYISINGTKYNPDTAIEMIKRNDSSLNISDVYPGDMRLVFPLGQDGTENQAAPAVGIVGGLGVKHGLLLSAKINGQKYTLCETEIDMLDLKVNQAAPIQANSKILLCLINQMTNSMEMNILTNGVYGAKKATSLLAIYNDIAFFPSIGEDTVPEGDTIYSLYRSVNMPSFTDKPGAKIYFPNAPENWTPSYFHSNGKWAAHGDRQSNTPFTLEWDDWDQAILKNTKSRIKKMFKRYYYKRKFNPEEDIQELQTATELYAKNFRAALTPAVGQRILPWFKRRRLIDNPFNAQGQLCKKPEN